MTDVRSDPPEGRYTRRFWEALADGRLLLHRCRACAEPFFPPAPVCPHCGSREVEWHESDGRGRLYSFTRQHATPPGFEAPLVSGLVELAEGPRLLVPIGADYDALAIGDPVRVRAADYGHGYDRGDLAGEPYLVAEPEDR